MQENEIYEDLNPTRREYQQFTIYMPCDLIEDLKKIGSPSRILTALGDNYVLYATKKLIEDVKPEPIQLDSESIAQEVGEDEVKPKRKIVILD